MATESFWPKPEAFLDISMIDQVTDDRARCTAVAICDAEGNQLRKFHQGQEAHFFYEFEVLGDIGVPSGGLEFHDSNGLVIHGKNSFQFNKELPRSVEKGQRLRFHHVIHLDVAPGNYWFTVGFASSEESSYKDYFTGVIGHEKFAPVEHCRVTDVAGFVVEFDSKRKLRHHGIADLKGDSKLKVMPAHVAPSVRPGVPQCAENFPPTIVHVTHWKAGSQWIHKILIDCVRDLIVKPKADRSQFLVSPIQPGKVYPTVYVTKPQFDLVALPPNSHYFVVIRDLRDTLISGYFSMKYSHPVVKDELSHLRPKLHELSEEEGMLHMINNWLQQSANIQSSWLKSRTRMIRYEDLLENDLEILEAELLCSCRLPVKLKRFRQVVINCRFEKMAAGRTRGTEDIMAHARKGVAGDWKSHFTPRMKDSFKNRFGDLLVATGYERDLNW